MNCILEFMVYGNTALPRLGELWHSPSMFCAVSPSSILSDPSSSLPPCESTRCSSRELTTPVFCWERSKQFRRKSIQSISCFIPCVQTHGATQTSESSTCWLVLCLNSPLRCNRTSCLTVQRWRCWRAHLEQFVHLFKVKRKQQHNPPLWLCWATQFKKKKNQIKKTLLYF